jgi:hypothetical protein
MFRKMKSFIKDYTHFALVIVAVVTSLALDLSGQDKFAHAVLGISAIISTLPLRQLT